jgi:hypothetical protein
MTALLLVGGAVGVSAADEVAVEEPATTPVWVTLTEQTNCSAGIPAEYSTGAGLAKRLRGLSFTCDNTFTDPRVSGRGSVVYNEDCFEDGVCVGWGTAKLDGPDGAWTGWWNEIDDEADNTSFYIVMTGTGAYEGLTFVRFSTGVWERFPNEYGVIYEGDPPPVEPPSAE